MLFITHDVADTQTFDRVLVMEGGTIVEDGAPAELGKLAGSRYSTLLHREAALKRHLLHSGAWRRLHMENGIAGGESEGADPCRIIVADVLVRIPGVHTSVNAACRSACATGVYDRSSDLSWSIAQAGDAMKALADRAVFLRCPQAARCPGLVMCEDRDAAVPGSVLRPPGSISKPNRRRFVIESYRGY